MKFLEKYILVEEGLGGVGEQVISIYCSGDGGSDPVQGAQGKTKYKVQNYKYQQNLIFKTKKYLNTAKYRYMTEVQCIDTARKRLQIHTHGQVKVFFLEGKRDSG